MTSAPFPVICGPTASGKTVLAVAVAIALGERGTAAEIISADAFQVYRELDIASAKPTAEERKGVPHHLIDVVDVEERITVAQVRGDLSLGLRGFSGATMHAPSRAASPDDSEKQIPPVTIYRSGNAQSVPVRGR